MKAENSVSVFFLSNFISLFLAVMGVCCYTGFSLAEVGGSYSLVAVHRLLIAMASLVAEHTLEGVWTQCLGLPGSRARAQ